jgi:hypothetical protein
MGVDLKLLMVGKEEANRWHVSQAIELLRNYNMQEEVRATVIGEVPEGVEVEGWGVQDRYSGHLQFTTAGNLANLELYGDSMRPWPRSYPLSFKDDDPNIKVVLFWH